LGCIAKKHVSNVQEDTVSLHTSSNYLRFRRPAMLNGKSRQRSLQKSLLDQETSNSLKSLKSLLQLPPVFFMPSFSISCSCSLSMLTLEINRLSCYQSYYNSQTLCLPALILAILARAKDSDLGRVLKEMHRNVRILVWAGSTVSASLFMESSPGCPFYPSVD